MMLGDYEFYINTYGGSVVTAEVFPAYQRKAKVALDRITYGHIVCDTGSYGQKVDGKFVAFAEQELSAVQMAVCALTEEIYRLEAVKQQALEGNENNGNIKSRSSGGESISYESKSTVYDEVIKDNRKKMQFYRDVLLENMPPELFEVNPFYAGRR